MVKKSSESKLFFTKHVKHVPRSKCMTNSRRYDEGVLKALLASHGGGVVDVDAASKSSGTTPLLIAAREGHEEVTRLLTAAGADVNKADKDGASPVHAAAREGHGAVVTALISSAGAAGAGDTRLKTRGLKRMHGLTFEQVMKRRIERKLRKTKTGLRCAFL